jgi:hypothetical protein
MPEHDNGCGAAGAEITASTELAKDFTLFQIEESLVLREFPASVRDCG